MQRTLLSCLAGFAAIGLAGCDPGPSPGQVSLAEDGQCQSWGHKPGSPGYAQCRENLFMNNQRFEAERRAAGMRLIEGMRSQQPPPPTYQMPITPARPPINCTTTNVGNTGYTNCN